METWEPVELFYDGQSFDYFESSTRDRLTQNEEELNFPPNPYSMANANAGPSVEIKSVEDVSNHKNIESSIQYALRSVGIKSSGSMKIIDSSNTIKQPYRKIDVDTFSGRPIVSDKYIKPLRSGKCKNRGNFDYEEVLRRYNDPNLPIEQKCPTLYNSPNEDSLDEVSQNKNGISNNELEIMDDSSETLNSTGSIAYQRLIPKSEKYLNPFSSSMSSTSSLSSYASVELSTKSSSSQSVESPETPNKRNNQIKHRKGRKFNYRKIKFDFCDNDDKPNITPPGFESVSKHQLYVQKARFN